METQGWIYLGCSDKPVCDRLQWWLDVDTRPMFADEAPEVEAGWFAPFEELEEPDAIHRLSDTELIARFDWLDGGDLLSLFEQILSRAGVANALWRETDGAELAVYYRLEQGRFQPLVSLTPLDDPEQERRHNRRLTPEQRRRLEALSEQPEQALSFLAALPVESGGAQA